MKLLSSAAVRRCLIADPGYAIISSDYDQIELRVVAALSGEQSMIDAAKRGESLHKLAAVKLFGEGYNPNQYKLAKNNNFTWVYGGGPQKMADKYRINIGQAREISNEYAKAFPALVAYKRREQEKVYKSALSSKEYQLYRMLKSRMYEIRSSTVEGKAKRQQIEIQIYRLLRGKIGYAFTPFGRRLVVDLHKAYAVVNYKVQSSSRDIFAKGLLDVMDDEELEPTVLLPIHDEILGQAPKADAEYYAQRYAEVMTTDFLGVPITASGKVYGYSWGHGYLNKN